MIQVEYFMTRDDGVVLNRTYSDTNHYIERDGIQYSEAVDPAELNRTYTETDILIEEPEIDPDQLSQEPTIEVESFTVTENNTEEEVVNNNEHII